MFYHIMCCFFFLFLFLLLPKTFFIYIYLNLMFMLNLQTKRFPVVYMYIYNGMGLFKNLTTIKYLTKLLNFKILSVYTRNSRLTMYTLVMVCIFENKCILLYTIYIKDIYLKKGCLHH